MKKMKVGFIGLGQRGAGLFIDGGGLMGCTFAMENVVVSAVCDVFLDRVERAVKIVEEKGYPRPFGTTDYRELLKQDLDVVIISSAWEAHVPLAIATMKAGIPTALEVGGGYSVDDCFRLVHTYEETGTPFMFLENCCYGKTELTITNMVRKGVFGEVVYCHGAYGHDLREEICGGITSNHYRLRNYMMRNCDNYPTHNLGPIAKLLNINRGNRMLRLSSMASKSCGLKAYAKENEKYACLADKSFQQGDIVHTSIICADGTLITLKLDTTLPRPYSREFSVSGTKAIYNDVGNVLMLDGTFEHDFTQMNDCLNTASKYENEYLPKAWKDMTQEEIELGHGGMDFIMLQELFSAVEKKKEMPIDVYDAATWTCITALSEKSIALGGAPVDIPDFTGGKWLMRKGKDIMEL